MSNRVHGRPGTEHSQLEELIRLGAARLPGLEHVAVITAFAGLRPATQFADYQIEALPDRQDQSR